MREVLSRLKSAQEVSETALDSAVSDGNTGQVDSPASGSYLHHMHRKRTEHIMRLGLSVHYNGFQQAANLSLGTT
eukprot:3904071-Amphidinium_carterae.1